MRACGHLRVERIFNGPAEEFLLKQLVEVDIIHLVVIIETLIAGDSVTAFNCWGQGPRTVGKFGERWFLTIVGKAGSYTSRTTRMISAYMRLQLNKEDLTL